MRVMQALPVLAAQLPERATRRRSRRVGVTVGFNVCLYRVWWYRRWVCAGAEEASSIVIWHKGEALVWR
jgi:hypothetical protein